MNFRTLEFIVEYSQENKGEHVIQYSVVSNLTLLSDEMLSFIKRNNISVSTSIDGPEALHNKNRPDSLGQGSYYRVQDKIKIIRDAGVELGAIETTTRAALSIPEEIVNLYLQLGFKSIFIRPLTPLGKAKKEWNTIGYQPEAFIDFYKKALARIIEVNLSGQLLREDHAMILLQRISGYPMNYMELRSPCGGGVGQIAYYPDGKVFTCDEARMLYETGDPSFLLGEVFNSQYNDLVGNRICRTVCSSSILESLPSCCDCVYQPYCGTCPVINYALYGDIIEKKPNNYRCIIYKGILDVIFSYLQQGDPDIMRIFDSWIKRGEECSYE